MHSLNTRPAQYKSLSQMNSSKPNKVLANCSVSCLILEDGPAPGMEKVFKAILHLSPTAIDITWDQKRLLSFWADLSSVEQNIPHEDYLLRGNRPAPIRIRFENKNDKVLFLNYARKKDKLRSSFSSLSSVESPAKLKLIGSKTPICTLDQPGIEKEDDPKRKSSSENDSPQTNEDHHSGNSSSNSPERAKPKRPRLVVDYAAEDSLDELGMDPAEEPTEESIADLKKRGINGASYTSVSERRAIKLAASDVGRLLPGYYLNDNLINFFSRVFMDEYGNQESKFSTHVFSTYFYSQAKKASGLDRMASWLNKVPLDKSIYLIPIHGAYHWTLAAVIGFDTILEENTLSLVLSDSLGVANIKARGIKPVVKDIFRKLFELKYPNEVFQPKICTIIAKTPSQSNSVDCGVFILDYVTDILRDPKRFVEEVNKKTSLLELDWDDISTNSDYGDREKYLSIVQKYATSEEELKVAASSDIGSPLDIEEVKVSKVKRNRRI